MITTALELRETNKYVGTYAHLDSWCYLGTVKELASARTAIDEDEDDICEPVQITKFVCVECDQPQPLNRIISALHDVYTSVGCHHEYDCCGCRSYYATAEHLKENKFQVTINSSRNY